MQANPEYGVIYLTPEGLIYRKLKNAKLEDGYYAVEAGLQEVDVENNRVIFVVKTDNGFKIIDSYTFKGIDDMYVEQLEDFESYITISVEEMEIEMGMPIGRTIH